MPYEEKDEDFLPEGFNPETGTWDDEQPSAEQPEEVAPTIEVPAAEPEQPVEQEEQVAPEVTIPLEAPVAPVPQTLKVKYNHEERELTLDEAAIYAQKGLNYDKLEERIRGYEASNAKSEQLALSLGYKSAAEMMEAAETNFIERQVKDLVDAGNTEAMARFLVEQQMAKAAAAAVREQPQEQPTPTAPAVPQPQQAQTPRISPEREAELREFVKAYPGITKLPDEVVNENRKGVRLLVAYERYQNKAALNELAILKQNQAAASKAPVTGVVGKAVGSQTPNAENDPFLKGFDSDTW